PSRRRAPSGRPESSNATLRLTQSCRSAVRKPSNPLSQFSSAPGIEAYAPRSPGGGQPLLDWGDRWPSASEPPVSCNGTNQPARPSVIETDFCNARRFFRSLGHGLSAWLAQQDLGKLSDQTREKIDLSQAIQCQSARMFFRPNTMGS